MTGNEFNKKKLIKNIKNFYSSKGIKNSFNFIFRIIYNSDINIVYGKDRILNLSDGRWIQEKIILIKPKDTNKRKNIISREICQREDYKNKYSKITARALVNYYTTIIKNQIYIWETHLSEIYGNFSEDKFILDLETNENYGKPYSILRDIQINDGGFGYKIGQKVNFSELSSSLVQPSVSVKRVSPSSSSQVSGTILEFNFENQGLGVNENNCGLSSNPIEQNGLTGGTGFSGSLIFGAVFEKNEYYNQSHGLLSSNMLLQDNKKWQAYSYIIRSDVSISKYRNLIKNIIHPAGMEFFAETLIKKCLIGFPDVFINIPSKLSKRIGNYLPYTFITSDNLGRWFNEFCYATGTHDTIIINDSALTGNPISSGENFVQASSGDCITADIPQDFSPQYWVTFNHPNSRITNAVGYILKDQLDDFYGPTDSGQGQTESGWQEWEYSSRYGGTTAQQEEWLEQILESSFEREFAKLFISGGTEFRKIPIYAFINEVQCTYDCRYSNNCVEEDSNIINLAPPLFPEYYDPKTESEKDGGDPSLVQYYGKDSEGIPTLSTDTSSDNSETDSV